eukprot:TRINITY_DN44183_c0_g1_i1.p1 TRINITY_DN44183_c0_g1~~TRINITY_DN44183_c0_g1_i1.p1  ORF type:complete len:532 (+),score=77.76 TRINITY_DN44183_c0_g1_i1:39-1598(+)
MASARADELRHAEPLTWHSRGAPLTGTNRGPTTWRERAAAHQARLGELGKPPKNSHAGPHSGPSACATSADFQEAAAAPAAAAIQPNTEEKLAGRTEETDDEVAAEIGEGEEIDDDPWGLLLRSDLERYALFKGAHLRGRAAEGDASARTTLEEEKLLLAVTDAVEFERRVLRRTQRHRHWPDTILAAPGTPYANFDELKRGLVERIGRLDLWRPKDGHQINHALWILREWPLDVLLYQLLSDVFAGFGEADAAGRALLEAVGLPQPPPEPEVAARDFKHAGLHRFPLLIGWEETIDCKYVKAQHCLRFSRFALCAILAEMGVEIPAGELLHIRPADGCVALEDRKPPLRKWPDSPVFGDFVGRTGFGPSFDERLRKALEEKVSRARRHLVDARRMYEGELQDLVKLWQWQSKELESCWGGGGAVLFGPQEYEEWNLILHCAHFAATALLAVAYRLSGALGGSGADREAQTLLSEALRHGAELRKNPAACPRLRRLLAAECRKLLVWQETWAARPVDGS